MINNSIMEPENRQFQQEHPVKPDSNLVWGIMTTIFCCLPLGLISIIMASKVDSLWAAGRYQEAYDASKSAWRWALAAIFTAILFIVISVAQAINFFNKLFDFFGS